MNKLSCNNILNKSIFQMTHMETHVCGTLIKCLSIMQSAIVQRATQKCPMAQYGAGKMNRKWFFINNVELRNQRKECRL